MTEGDNYPLYLGMENSRFMTKADLIEVIADCAKRINRSPATVTKNAVGNPRLYKHLRQGGTCTIDVSERIIAFVLKVSPQSLLPSQK